MSDRSSVPRTRLGFRRVATAVALVATTPTAGCSVGPGGYGNAAARADASRYPSDSVQVIVPYEAGGATDLMVRALSQPIADALGTEPLVVLNQPGGMFAGGRCRRLGPIPIGAELACRSTLAGVTVKRGAPGSWRSSPSATS